MLETFKDDEFRVGFLREYFTMSFFGIFGEKKSYYFSKFVLGFLKKRRIPIFEVSFNWHESSRKLSFQKRYFYEVVKKPKASQSQKSLHVVSQLRLDNSPLFATICHYLSLFATICHYSPLIVAIC